ncbi:MAG: CDP-glucose 4,6-dehydratase [Paracoccaceae bacterium]
MEDLGLNKSFWKGRSVFLTGHTGFKGGWLALWLASMGARVHGYSLAPPARPALFSELHLDECLESSAIADIRDLQILKRELGKANPSVIFHLAAQPLVRKSYQSPVDTFSTNVLGSVNLFEAALQSGSVEAVVNVTSDKCYQNIGRNSFFVEEDPLGGDDPYSASKACSEIVTASYWHSFFRGSGIGLATGRAGNVIGGGDWAQDRLIPDFLRALDSQQPLRVRSPNAIRPWQHVLEPLAGYLLVAEKACRDAERWSGAWNFGPSANDTKPVSWIVDFLSTAIPNEGWEVETDEQPNEAGLLKLNSSKAKSMLNWTSRWSIEDALTKTVEWHQAWKSGTPAQDISLRQIEEYMSR